MSLVGVALDSLLILLLVAALVYGWRLEKKLRALRDSQAAFAASVRDLDLAAARAEAGLESLRRAGEEAHDGLHDRILKARELKTQLEALIARAERMPAPPAAPSRAAPDRGALAEPERPALARPRSEERLRPESRFEERLRPAAEPAPLRRPRATDDDLFDPNPAPLAPRRRRTFGDDR